MGTGTDVVVVSFSANDGKGVVDSTADVRLAASVDAAAAAAVAKDEEAEADIFQNITKSPRSDHHLMLKAQVI